MEVSRVQADQGIGQNFCIKFEGAVSELGRKVSRFVQEHKLLVTAGAIVAGLLIAALAVTVIGPATPPTSAVGGIALAVYSVGLRTLLGQGVHLLSLLILLVGSLALLLRFLRKPAPVKPYERDNKSKYPGREQFAIELQKIERNHADWIHKLQTLNIEQLARSFATWISSLVGSV